MDLGACLKPDHTPLLYSVTFTRLYGCKGRQSEKLVVGLQYSVQYKVLIQFMII